MFSFKFFSYATGSCHGRDPMVVAVDLQLPGQSVPITTKVVSSDPAHGGCALCNIM